jgi:hypothetical protein
MVSNAFEWGGNGSISGGGDFLQPPPTTITLGAILNMRCRKGRWRLCKGSEEIREYEERMEQLTVFVAVLMARAPLKDLGECRGPKGTMLVPNQDAAR